MRKSANLHRRNLSVSQKALIAENGLKLEMRLAKERMAAGGGDRKSEKAKSGMATLPPPISKGKARDAVGGLDKLGDALFPDGSGTVHECTGNAYGLSGFIAGSESTYGIITRSGYGPAFFVSRLNC